MKVDTVCKQLLFSTIRVQAGNHIEQLSSIGTGFLILSDFNASGKQIFLVTNKHVVTETDKDGKFKSNWLCGKITFLRAKGDEPDLGNSFPVVVNDGFSDRFFMHPDDKVDLAISNISSIIDYTAATQQNIFIRAIPLEMIPEKHNFDAIEDIIFVGYPNGIWDNKNFIPVTRRGSTATPFNIDYCGKKKFLIDAHVFPGSSGSPVFIKESNLKNGALTFGSNKYHLVGIISEGHTINSKGELIQEIVPTNIKIAPILKQMMGLGVCEKAKQLKKLIELYNQHEKAKHHETNRS
jgi:hypothetical protein